MEIEEYDHALVDFGSTLAPVFTKTLLQQSTDQQCYSNMEPVHS
jgi:hypothetical protein